MRQLRDHARTLAPLAALAALGGSAASQNVDLMLRRNDPVIGNGNITIFDQIAVNNTGFFYSQVKTDDPDSDEVLLLNGFMVMGRGINVAQPVGATYKSAVGGSMSVNDHGFIGWGLSLNGTPLNKDDDNGLYWNTLLMAQEGSPPFTDNVGGIPFTTIALGGELDTTYQSFTLGKLNDRNSILVVGTLDDDGFRGQEAYASLMTTNGVGQLVNEEFLAVRRYPFPGTGDEVDSVSTSSVTWDLNDKDEWIGQVILDVNGSRTSTLLKNGAVELQALEESPGHPGRNITGFSSMSMNNHGDYVVSTLLDGEKTTDTALVMNGTIAVVTEGDIFPGLSPHRVVRFDGAPVEIVDSRDVFWYANTSNVSAQQRYYFRSVYKGNDTWEHKVIAQQGVTIAVGSPISDLRTIAGAFAVSDNGRFWVGEVLLANGSEALLSADFGSSVPLYGCDNVHQGTLQKVDGDPLIGTRLTYHVDGPIMPGSSPILLWSTQPAIPGSECGIRAGKREFMINPTKPQNFAKQIGTPYDGSPVVFTIDLPLDPALVDMTIYAQASIMNTNSMLRLTPGVAVAVGQPN